MTDQALLDALDRLRGTGPEFDGFLANHGPMAAEALTQMGGAADVPRWVDGYLPRLDSAPEVRRGIGDDDWREHLGDEALFGDWTAFLRTQAPTSDGSRPGSIRGRVCCPAWLRQRHARRDPTGACGAVTAVAWADPTRLCVDELAGARFRADRYPSVPTSRLSRRPLDRGFERLLRPDS